METAPYRIIRPKELTEILGISTPTLYQWIDKGLLPPKVQIGPKAVGWRSDHIEQFIEERTEVREVEATK